MYVPSTIAPHSTQSMTMTGGDFSVEISCLHSANV
jgi:hypothetical protein